MSVLPVFQQIGSPTNSEEQNKEYRINLLKQLAEMSPHCGDLDKTEQCVSNVYNCLIVSSASSNDAFLTEGNLCFYNCMCNAGHGGLVVSSVPCIWRVAGSNPTLAAS